MLVAYADTAGQPTDLVSQILAEPGVSSVDLFDAATGTPTLAQLEQYNVVVPFSNSPFQDGVVLGDNLADYVDEGGIVIQYGFSFYGPGQPYGINGRWLTGNYNPYNYSINLSFTPFTLGTYSAAHPIMAGVTTLNSTMQNVVTPASGATEVAAASNGNSLVAFRPVSGGHTTVGVTGYVGVAATQSGHWGRVVVNAAKWLCPAQHYIITTQTGQSIVPGVVDIGNHCDDCTTTFDLPFPVHIYGVPYTSANVGSNGTIQFTTNSTSVTNACPLPSATHAAAFFPYWDDLRTDNALGLTGRGIFTTVTGSAPNRTFYIEWRAKYFANTAQEANFEFAYNEADQVLKTIYGTVFNGNTSATTGVQESGTGIFDQYGCNGTGGAISSGRAVLYLPPLAPTVTSVSPAIGPTGGLQGVVINGTNFSSVNWVSFGGTAAPSFTVNSPTKITATSPAHVAGTFHIRVGAAAGNSNLTAADQYTYTNAPGITSISPRAGPPGGGQSVVINGFNFSGVNWVSFGSTAAASYTVNSAFKITATSPAHAAGALHVRVNTAAGTSPATGADLYYYETAPTISSVSPRAGPPAGGQTVIILGTNFGATNWVSFGGTAAASFTVNSMTKITAVTPAHAGALVHVRVNTPLGTSAITDADKYAFEGAPSITSVSPQIGPAAGSQTVIIHGANLFGANWVSFGGTAASFTVNSPSQITATTPAHAAGTFHVRVNTPLGTSAATNADLYVFGGWMVASSLTVGFASNNWGYLATDAVNYLFARGKPAANDFAIFQTHDPWGGTVLKNAITGAGHTYTVFTPAQLAGFAFSNYRVVVLNWDETNVTDFNTPYSAAITALENYVKAGGALWIQAAIQGTTGQNFTLPFGGTETWDLSPSDFIADAASPLVAGAPNPLTGNYASHASYSSLPGDAHIIVKKTDASGPPVLYELRR